MARRGHMLALTALVFIYALVEGVAFVGLHVLEATGRTGYAPTLTDSVSPQHREIFEKLLAGTTGYLGFDPILGWTNQPGGRNDLYSANRQGIRSDHEYSLAPSPDRTRIAAFGDSFMHADDVPDDDAWSTIVENSEADIEVLNFGVGGYGPDQAYLRYLEEGARFDADLVFIGMMSENINRIVNVYRPFYTPDTGNPLAKPFFRLVDGQLVRNPNPVPTLAAYSRLLEQPEEILPTLGENDFHYSFRYKAGPLDFSPLVRLTKIILFELKDRHAKPFFAGGQYQMASDEYQLLDRLLRDFRCAALDRGSLPITVLFPHRADIAAAIDGKPVSYQPLADELRSEGHPVIDLADAFASLPPETSLDELVLAHYTGRGNALIASFIVEKVRESGLDTSAGRQRLKAQQHTHCPSEG